MAQICSENKYVSRSEISLFFWWNGTKDIDIRSFAEFYEKFDKYDSLMLKLDDVGELFFGSGLLDESKENEVLLKSLFKPQIMLPLGNVLNSNLRKNQLKFTNFSNFLIKTEAEMLSRVKKFVHERVNQMKRKKIGVLITPEIQEAIDTLKTKLPLSADLINSFMSTYAKNWSEGELKALTWIGLLTYDQISDWYYNKSPIDNSQLNENSLVFFIDYLCDLQKNKTDVYYHKKVINEDLKHQNKQNMKLFIDFKKHFNLLKVHLTHEEINSLKILSNLNDEFISNQDFNQMVTTENYFSLRTDSPNALFQLDKLIIFLKHKLELKLHDILFSNEQDDEFEVIKELIEERTINIGKLVRMFRLGLLNDEKIDKLKQMNILNKLGSFDMNLFKIKFMKSIENLSSGTSFITNLVKNSWLKFGYISFNLQKELLDKAQEELFNSHRDNIILDTQIIEDIKYFMAENESGLEFDMRLIDCYKPRCPREKVKVVGMSLRDFETIFNSQINEITKLNLLMNHLFFKENIDLDTFIKGLNKFELTNLNDIHLEHLIKKKIITKDLSIEYMCHVDNLKRCELANEQPSENFIDKLHGFYLDFGMLPKKFIDDRFIKQEQKIRADDWNYFMLEEGIVDTDKLKLFFLNNKFQYVQLAELDKFGKIIDAFTKEDLFEDTPLQRGRSIDKIFNPRKIKGISIKNIRNVILNRLKVVDFESYNQMNKYVANCLIKQIPYSKKALDVNNFDFNGEYKNLLDSFHMHFNEKDVTIDPNFLKSLSLYVTQLRRMKHKMQLIEYKQLIFKIKQQQLFAQIISLSERLAMDRLNTKRTIVKRKKTVDKVLLTKNDTSDKQDVESDNNQEIKFKVTRFNDFSQFKQTAKQVRFTALSQVSPLFDMMNVLKMKSDDADSADSSTESNSENVSSSDGSLVIKKTTETKYRDRKSSIKKQTTRLEPREKNIKRAQPNREKKESNRKIINIKIKENKYKATNKYGKTHEIVSLPIKSKQKTSLPKADIIDTRRKTSISPAKVTQQRLNSLGDNIPNAVIVNDVVYDEKKDLQLVEPAAVLIQHSKLERVTKKSINIAEITETQVILTDETHEGLRELAKSSNSPEKTGTFVESRNENLIPSIEVFSNEELTIEVNGSENASQSHVSETQNQGNAFKELPQIVNQKEVTQNIEIQQKFIEHNHVINNKPLREEKNKQEILRNEEEQQEILDKETRNEANLNQFKGEESKSIAREELIGSEKNEQQYQNENKKLVLIKIQQEENKTSIIKNSQDYTSQTSVSNNDSKENLKKILIVPNIGDNEITKETKQFTKKLISTLKTLPKIRKRFKDRKSNISFNSYKVQNKKPKLISCLQIELENLRMKIS